MERLAWKPEGADSGLWALRPTAYDKELQRVSGTHVLTLEETLALGSAEKNDSLGFAFDGESRLTGSSYAYFSLTLAEVVVDGGSIYKSTANAPEDPYMFNISGLALSATSNACWMAGDGAIGYEISLRSLENGLPLVGSERYLFDNLTVEGMWHDGSNDVLWVLDDLGIMHELDCTNSLNELGAIDFGTTGLKGLAHDGNQFRLYDPESNTLLRTAGLPDSQWAFSSTVAIDNSNLPPVADELHLSYQEPGFGNDLMALWQYNDVNSDVETGSTVEWFRMGESNAVYSGSVQGTYNGYSYSLLPASYIVRNEEWYFTVVPHDGYQPGELTSSLNTNVTLNGTPETFILLNNRPVITAVEVEPADVPGAKLYATDTFTVTNISASDADTDPLTYSYQWWKGVTNAPIAALAGATNDVFVPATFGMTHYEAFFCAVKAYDGSEYSEVYDSNPILLDNAAPDFTSLPSGTLTFYKGQPFNIVPVTSVDPEGDAVTYTFSGWCNAQSGTVSIAQASGGDTVTIRAESWYDIAYEAQPPALETNISVLVLFPAGMDSDGDGLDDEWEERMWGYNTISNANHSADDDPDGDNYVNLSEMVAGTDPEDGSSYFAIGATDMAGGIVTVTFATEPGRMYQLQKSTDLSNPAGWSDFGSAISGDGTQKQFQDASASDSASYYRVRVWRP